MIQRAELGVVGALVRMLERPRRLPDQTLRHLEAHLDSSDLETDLAPFLQGAANELEEYEVEVIFGPVFTPAFDEQVEITDALAAQRPTSESVADLVARTMELITACDVLLPDGRTVPLTLHEVMVERYIKLLRLKSAPSTEVTETVRDMLRNGLAPVALALLRGRGLTAPHQEWFAEFLVFASDRHEIDRETLGLLIEFLAAQTALGHEQLDRRLDSFLRASIQAGEFAAKGRMYWSSDVAEHHGFQGQGVIDNEDVDKRRREVKILETLKADLTAFHDLGAPRN